MVEKMQFAPTVMLIDAAYLDWVVSGLRNELSNRLGRELPVADLSILFECLALDGGIRDWQDGIQVFLLYDDTSVQLSSCMPSHLEKELNNVAFRSSVGEINIHSFYASSLITLQQLFTESFGVLAVNREVRNLIVVPGEYGGESSLINDFRQAVVAEKGLVVMGMTPYPDCPFDFIGYAILRSLGVSAAEL